MFRWGEIVFRLGENLVHPNIRQFIVCFIEKLYYNFSKYQYLGDLMMIEGGGGHFAFENKK